MQMQYYDINIMKYGNDYRVTYMKRFYSDSIHSFDKDPDMIGDRFSSNISRAKNTILGYGKCNIWDYFVTFTLDKTKYNRFDLDFWRSDFSQYIRDQRKKGFNIKYLLIPERHKDGAWHMHGLLSGIPWDFLLKFNPDIHPIDLVKNGYRYHEGILYKFGFNSFGKLRNVDAAAAYVLKYCGKGFALQDLDSGSHLYYASHGLNKPVKILDSSCGTFLTQPDFENEFCAVSWIKEEEFLRIFEYLG